MTLKSNVTANENKENIFKTIQKFLKSPPVIIWGSGATAAYGFPTMQDLNSQLKDKISKYSKTSDNIEKELSKEKYKRSLPEIRKTIWEAIAKKDVSLHLNLIQGKAPQLESIKKIITFFKNTHPEVVNIITPNYDRVLEHVLAYHHIPFTDGFEGKELSSFNKKLFKNSDIVNLIKVHGSLNWFDIDGDARYLRSPNFDFTPYIVPPSNRKYEETNDSPYRDLIQKSDELIEAAKSFLVIGFGFNDEHLTPKLKKQITSGTPIVLITKSITPSCKKLLEITQKYVCLEENINQTRVTIKESKDAKMKEYNLEKDYWKLDKFLEVLCND